MVKNGFNKWLNSTKFQVCIIGMTLLYFAPVFFIAVDPTRTAELIRDIVIGYFGARVAEPVVEGAVNWILPRFKKNHESADTEGE